jgi:hypothetical protein
MVHSRKFCCCLPVRFGVFVLSILAMAGGAFVAAYGYIQIARQNKYPLTRDDRIALWIQSVMFTFLSLLAVFGFLGALTKNRRMVSNFAIGVAIHLGFSVAAGIYALVSLFKQDPQIAIDNCMNSGADGVTIDGCRSAISIMKGVMVGVYVCTWLIQLYAYFVVERYVDQLDDEASAKHAVVIPQTMPQVGAPMMTTYGAFQPQYPFTAPGQAQGTTHGRDASNNV